MRGFVVLVLFAAWPALPACSDTGGEPDASIDAGEDAGIDAGSDPDADPGVDAGDPGDAGSDPGSDPGADPGIDAGFDGGSDAGTDAGWDAGTLPDHDPQSSFLLIIPPGTSLCTVFCEGRTWQEEHQMLGRIDLIPGAYLLPRTEGPLAGDLIGGVVFGPDHVPAEPTGPGSFDVRYYYGAWIYDYDQDFLLQNQPYHLKVTIWFEPAYWGPTWPAQVTLEGEWPGWYAWAQATLGSGTGWCADRQGFGFHDLSLMPGADHHGTTASGDWVIAEVRFAVGCNVAGNTNCEEIDRAEVSLSGVHREVTDPVELIYSAGHHNVDQKYLLLLDPPVGETAAVLIEAPDMGATSGGALIRLDASLAPLGSEPFTDWQTTWH